MATQEWFLVVLPPHSTPRFRQPAEQASHATSRRRHFIKMPSIITNLIVKDQRHGIKPQQPPTPGSLPGMTAVRTEPTSDSQRRPPHRFSARTGTIPVFSGPTILTAFPAPSTASQKKFFCSADCQPVGFRRPFCGHSTSNTQRQLPCFNQSAWAKVYLHRPIPQGAEPKIFQKFRHPSPTGLIAPVSPLFLATPVAAHKAQTNHGDRCADGEPTQHLRSSKTMRFTVTDSNQPDGDTLDKRPTP